MHRVSLLEGPPTVEGVPGASGAGNAAPRDPRRLPELTCVPRIPGAVMRCQREAGTMGTREVTFTGSLHVRGEVFLSTQSVTTWQFIRSPNEDVGPRLPGSRHPGSTGRRLRSHPLPEARGVVSAVEPAPGAWATAPWSLPVRAWLPRTLRPPPAQARGSPGGSPRRAVASSRPGGETLTDRPAPTQVLGVRPPGRTGDVSGRLSLEGPGGSLGWQRALWETRGPETPGRSGVRTWAGAAGGGRGCHTPELIGRTVPSGEARFSCVLGGLRGPSWGVSGDVGSLGPGHPAAVGVQVAEGPRPDQTGLPPGSFDWTRAPWGCGRGAGRGTTRREAEWESGRALPRARLRGPWGRSQPVPGPAGTPGSRRC